MLQRRARTEPQPGVCGFCRAGWVKAGRPVAAPPAEPPTVQAAPGAPRPCRVPGLLCKHLGSLDPGMGSLRLVFNVCLCLAPCSSVSCRLFPGPSGIYSWFLRFLQYLLSCVTCLCGGGFTSFCRCHLIGIYRSYLFLPNRSCPHSAIYTAVMWVACLAFPLPVSSALIHPAPEGRGWKGSFVCLRGGTGCCLGTSVLLVVSPPPAG